MAAMKQSPAAISSPLADSDVPTNSTAGVTATRSPTREYPGSSGDHSSNVARATNTAEQSQKPARPRRVASAGSSARRMSRPGTR